MDVFSFRRYRQILPVFRPYECNATEKKTTDTVDNDLQNCRTTAVELRRIKMGHLPSYMYTYYKYFLVAESETQMSDESKAAADVRADSGGADAKRASEKREPREQR